MANREGWFTNRSLAMSEPCLGRHLCLPVYLELPSVLCACPGEGAKCPTALLILQTKYDANQQAKKHLLPVSTGDLSSKEHHRSPLEKPRNGVLFPQHGDYQYGRNNTLTDHFQYSRQSYPNSYNLNRYDV